MKPLYGRLRGIVGALTKRGLMDVERLEDERKSLMIRLTPKGRRLLEELRKLKRILEDYGLT